MTQTDLVVLAVAVGLTVLAMIMAMLETALHQITRSRADRMVAQNLRGARRVKEILEDPAPVATATRLLMIASQVTAIVLVCRLFSDIVSGANAQLALPIVVMIVISFVVWGVAPRTLGRRFPEQIAGRCSWPMSIIASIVWPISQLLIWVGNALTPGPGLTEGPFSPEAEKIAEASEDEREMINSVFELGETLAREVMVPRTDVVHIPGDKTLRQGLSLALRSGFSRIPVTGDSLDDVVGIVYVKDLMRRVYDNPDAEKRETVNCIMRPAVFVPDSLLVDNLLREMQTTRNHIVVVVDEFGGTAGIATIEDLIEEIVGEITDEYDAEPDLVQEVEPGLWRLSVRMPIDDVGAIFGLDLDDEDVETVGGLLAKELNLVPIKGSCIQWRGLRITAESVTGRRHRLDTVLVRQATEDELAEPNVAPNGASYSAGSNGTGSNGTGSNGAGSNGAGSNGLANHDATASGRGLSHNQELGNDDE